MKKTILLSSIVFLIALSFAFRENPPRFENLKVLPKNTNKHEIDSIMKHFSMSLGVRCTHCHVRNNDEKKDFNFASDDNKNKLIARNMYKMMLKINKKYFKEEGDEEKSVNRIPEVSCFTCHHGKEHPENRPPAPPMPGPGQGPGPGGQAGQGAPGGDHKP
jgi:hypothetical protein